MIVECENCGSKWQLETETVYAVLVECPLCIMWIEPKTEKEVS